MDSFAASLSEDKTSVYAVVTGTPSEAKLFVERNRGRDGFMSHFFSGSATHHYARSATHTFLVVPGVWASAIIREFGQEVLRGPLFPDDDDDHFDKDRFVRGDLGVVLETSCGEVLEKLKLLKPGCPYRLVRFYSVES